MHRDFYQTGVYSSVNSNGISPSSLSTGNLTGTSYNPPPSKLLPYRSTYCGSPSYLPSARQESRAGGLDPVAHRNSYKACSQRPHSRHVNTDGVDSSTDWGAPQRGRGGRGVCQSPEDNVSPPPVIPRRRRRTHVPQISTARENPAQARARRPPNDSGRAKP